MRIQQCVLHACQAILQQRYGAVGSVLQALERNHAPPIRFLASAKGCRNLGSNGELQIFSVTLSRLSYRASTGNAAVTVLQLKETETAAAAIAIAVRRAHLIELATFSV